MLLGRLEGVDLKIGKTKSKNREAEKKRSGLDSRRRQSGRRSETTGEGFVKQVGFKLGVKERSRHIGCTHRKSKNTQLK